jgi:ankyrin repeat protein
MLEWLAAGVLVKAGAALAGWSRLRSPHALARAGYLSKLEPLLRRTPRLVHARDRRGQTPLMHAARSGQRAAVCLLLQRGADPNALCERGGTALMMAAELGNAELVGALLRAGARVNERDAEQATALHLAAGTGGTDAVRALLRGGADCAARNRQGRTALELALGAGHAVTAAALRVKSACALGDLPETAGSLDR